MMDAHNLFRKMSAFLIGAIFGQGLIISQMTNPEKVLNFLDLAGRWDPSLLFVMLGAVPVTFVGYRVVLKNEGPFFEDKFRVPTSTHIDSRLIGGAIIFGIGWGLSGLCPAPSLVGFGAEFSKVVAFVVAMIVGMISYRLINKTVSQ